MGGFSLSQIPKNIPLWQQQAFRTIAISTQQQERDLSAIGNGQGYSGNTFYTASEGVQAQAPAYLSSSLSSNSGGGVALLNAEQTFTQPQSFEGNQFSTNDIISINRSGGNSFLFNYKATASSGKIKVNDSAYSETGVSFTNDRNDEKILSLNLNNLSDNSTRVLSPMNYSGSIPVVGNAASASSGALAAVSLTNQTTGIAATNLTNTPLSGLYLITVYAVVTTGDVSAPLAYIRFDYTDDSGPQIESYGAGAGLPYIDLAISGSRTQYSFPVHIASGNITYQVQELSPFNDAVYSLYIRLTYLG